MYLTKLSDSSVQYFFFKDVEKVNNYTTDVSITADTYDLHISPYIVQETVDDQNLNLTTEPLYPHERDCAVVIVPKQKRPDDFLAKIIRNGDIKSVGIAMVTLTILRILIERASHRKWFAIAFRTFGMFFSQVVMRDGNSIESSWTNIVKGFSAIATTVLSAIIYNNLVNDKYHEIDTIDQLIASNLTVLAPTFLRNDLQLRLSNNREQLLKQIVFQDIEAIGSLILDLNYSFAYILQENPAKNYLKMLNSQPKEGDSGRIMTENLCEL